MCVNGLPNVLYREVQYFVFLKRMDWNLMKNLTCNFWDIMIPKKVSIFVLHFLNKLYITDTNFSAIIVYMDGNVHKLRCWVTGNRRRCSGYCTQYSQNIIVCTGILPDHIVGPYVFTSNVTSAFRLIFWIIPEYVEKFSHQLIVRNAFSNVFENVVTATWCTTT